MATLFIDKQNELPYGIEYNEEIRHDFHNCPDGISESWYQDNVEQLGKVEILNSSNTKVRIIGIHY